MYYQLFLEPWRSTQLESETGRNLAGDLGSTMKAVHTLEILLHTLTTYFCVSILFLLEPGDVGSWARPEGASLNGWMDGFKLGNN